MQHQEPSRAPQGPSMVCATSALNAGPTRIGHIGGNISLPRTVEIKQAAAVVGGALLGLILAMTLVPVGGVAKFVYAIIFGGGAGWVLTSFSPLKGESLSTWIALQITTLRRQRTVNGNPVVVAVGTALVDRETFGKLVLQRASVRVTPGTYDERGVLISEANRNTYTDHSPPPGGGEWTEEALVAAVAVNYHDPNPQSRRRPGTAPLAAVPGAGTAATPPRPAGPQTTISPSVQQDPPLHPAAAASPTQPAPGAHPPAAGPSPLDQFLAHAAQQNQATPPPPPAPAPDTSGRLDPDRPGQGAPQAAPHAGSNPFTVPPAERPRP